MIDIGPGFPPGSISLNDQRRGGGCFASSIGFDLVVLNRLGQMYQCQFSGIKE